MSEKKETKIKTTPGRKVLKGTVVSDKMKDSITVKVDNRKQHPLYGKIIRQTRKYMVHDHKNEAGVGDFVMIEETRPISKHKRWRLVQVIEKAK